VVDTCFCSPVAFVKTSKGYSSIFDVVKATAITVAFFSEKIRYTGFFSKKPVERVYEISYVYYPLQLICISDKVCYIVDTGYKIPSEYTVEVNGYHIVKSIGLIADLVILMYESRIERTPYTPVVINEEVYRDEFKRKLFDTMSDLTEYSVPKLKGEGLYMIPILVVRYREIGRDRERTVLSPPVWLSEGADPRYLFSTFNRLESIIDKMFRLYSDKWIEYSNKLFNIEDPVSIQNLKKGLKKLWEEGLLSEEYTRKYRQLYL